MSKRNFIILLLIAVTVILLDTIMSVAGNGPPPTPTPSLTFHQVGGIAQGTSKTKMCCSFYSDVCAPCGNPAQGFSYQTQNSCNGAMSYKNLWVRCQDPKCSNLTKGSYKIQLCHFNKVDPSDTTGTEYCGEVCEIKPGPDFNHCNADDGVPDVSEGDMIYVKIVPSSKPYPAPNAPLKALWTALVEGCDNEPFCGDGIVNGDEECEESTDCGGGVCDPQNCLCTGS